MTPDDWIKVGAGFVSGGFLGATLTNFVNWRNRRQLQVGYRTEIYPVLDPKPDHVSLAARVVVDHDGKSVEFDNLYLAQLRITNRGPTDLKRFTFGVTLPSAAPKVYEAIRVDGESADRHHVVDGPVDLSPMTPRHGVDLVLTPFNRRDQYTVRLYFIRRPPLSSEGPVAADVVLSTSEAATFVPMPSFGEILAARLAAPSSTVAVVIKSGTR